jgi:hypothetical protein
MAPARYPVDPGARLVVVVFEEIKEQGRCPLIAQPHKAQSPRATSRLSFSVWQTAGLHLNLIISAAAQHNGRSNFLFAPHGKHTRHARLTLPRSRMRPQPFDPRAFKAACAGRPFRKSSAAEKNLVLPP